jgi:hypothetical protein
MTLFTLASMDRLETDGTSQAPSRACSRAALAEAGWAGPDRQVFPATKDGGYMYQLAGKTCRGATRTTQTARCVGHNIFRVVQSSATLHLYRLTPPSPRPLPRARGPRRGRLLPTRAAADRPALGGARVPPSALGAILAGRARQRPYTQSIRAASGLI